MTELSTLRPPDWTRDADCASHPLGPDAWDGHGTPAARRVCAECPVRHPCALDALTIATPTGLWGGLDPDDRTRIAADIGYHRPGTPRHGTRSRYGHRTHPCRCALCTEAMRRWKANYVATRPAATNQRKIAS